MPRFEIQRHVVDPDHPWKHSGWIEAATPEAALAHIKHDVERHQGTHIRSGRTLSIAAIEDGMHVYVIYNTVDTGYWHAETHYRIVPEASEVAK